MTEEDKLLNLTPEEFQKAHKILNDKLLETVKKFDAVVNTDDKVGILDLYSEVGLHICSLGVFDAFKDMKKSELK